MRISDGECWRETCSGLTREVDDPVKPFFQSLLLAETGSPRIAAVAVILIMVVISSWLYRVAHVHAETVNTDVLRNDQFIYLEYAEKLVKTDYAQFLPRQRMPSYFYFLTLFWEEGMDRETFFALAKHINIIVTIVLLFAILAFSRMFLPWTESALMALIPGVLVFVLKAGYAQPEVFLMAITWVCSVLLMRMIRRPAWPLAIVTGVCMWLWQYTKSSALVALLLFCIAYAIKYLWIASRDKVWQSKERLRPWILTVARGILVPTLFFTLFFPYARESKEVFGSWLYSVHTRYLFWCDTPEEKQEINRLKLAIRPSDMPANELPSGARFWQEHSLKEILERPIDGAMGQIRRIAKYYPGFARLFQYYFWVAVVAGLLRRHRALALLRAHFFEALFLAMFFFAYLALCGWWEPLGLGARIILAFSLVPLFALIWWVWQVTRDWNVRYKANEVSVRKLINLAAAVLVGLYGWKVFTKTVFEFYAGG